MRKMLFRNAPPEIAFCKLLESGHEQEVIECAITSKDITRNIVRCRSSNLWGYVINVRSRKDTTGDLYIQFKGKEGGPTGGMYVYYDVPVRVYKKLITAPSKGHYFWVNIRNRYRYSKLTGDKRGKLPNAVN